MKPPKICRYCGSRVVLTNSSVIYGKDYGDIYLCTNCNAFVGAHKDTGKPMGELANVVLRMKRRETHRAFDAYWKGAGLSRSAGYKWLAGRMELPVKKTHIGYFDMEQCEDVIKLCKAAHQAA